MARLRSRSMTSSLASRCSSALMALCWLGLPGTLLLSSCSSDHKGRGSTDTPKEGEATLSGTLAMALTARGDSGSLYRLRDATFQVNDPNFFFFQTFNTENDPLATRLEATLPTGDFQITLFGGFALERVEPDGSVVRVSSSLLSPSSQTFHIDANQETNVEYRFETSGEIIAFGGDGRLVVNIDVAEREGESRRTVIETSQTALSSVTLRETLDAALQNGGMGGTNAEEVYHALIESYNESPGRDPSLRHCDDELTNGQPSLNGFPLACPRFESEQFDNLDAWFALAFVNRLDLAPTDGSNCGQQRMIFANPFNGRMFIIIEAEIPNPTPECGVNACRPVAEFWESLATVPDADERGGLLRDAFLSSGVGPIGPFINAQHLGPDGGQIRTNNFNDFQWTLREFRVQPAPFVLPVQVSVSEAPNGELWNDTSTLPQAATCRASFLASIPNLLSDNLATMGFPVAEVCEDAESPNDFFRQDYASHLGFGSGEFTEEIETLIEGSGLSAFDVASRARFAGSCIGCHIESGGASLGRGVFAPPQFDFVQVSEFATESCPEGGTCFGISEALRTVFLPHRIDVQRNFLASSDACGEPAPDPGGFDGGVAPFAADRVATLRTLGGQPVVEHAH
jgi:hypothetical protein